MKCPNCSEETNIVLTKKEYVYPKWFLGLPTFWSFISPTMARSITAMILALSVVLIFLALLGVSQGVWFVGVLYGLCALFALYAFAICVKSLGKDQVKAYYKCNTCNLEWSWFNQSGRQSPHESKNLKA